MRYVSIKINTSDVAIIVNYKKDFSNFGLEGLQPKPRGRPKSIDTNNRKNRKSDKTFTREGELLLEVKALRFENELLKKL